MRLILYMLFVVGSVLVAVALGIVFLGDDDIAEVAPQANAIDLLSKAANGPVSAAVDNSRVSQSGTSNDGLNSVDIKNMTGRALNIEIARVKPDGAAVVAGDAPPGAVISVFEGKILLGKTTADSNGEWVVVLEKRLGAGQHLISVAAVLTNE